MKTVILSEYEKRKGKWGGTQPYTIAFCYPRGGLVTVKGMCEEVEKYIENKLGVCHYRITYWMNGKSRGMWRVNRKDSFLHLTNNNKTKHQRYNLIIFSKGKVIVDKWMRSLPKHFMRELEVLG